jgi:hypothetical protein
MGSAPPNPWKLFDREGRIITVFQRTEVPAGEIRSCTDKGLLVPDGAPDAKAIALHPATAQLWWDMAEAAGE